MIKDDPVSALLLHFDEDTPATINSLARATGWDSRVVRSRLLQARDDGLVVLSTDYQRWCLTERGRTGR